MVHVQHLDDGVRVWLRLPAPYVLAPRLGPQRADGTREAAPYTSNRMENGELMHYLDLDALHRDPEGLARMVADGHRLTVDGRTVTPAIEGVRLHPALTQPPFASLEEATRAFPGPVFPVDVDSAYAGDTVIDVVLRYRTGGAVYDYAFGSTLDPGLPAQDETANLVLDHFPGETLVFRERGLLAIPIEVSRSALSAALTFIAEGVRHILEGTDHVLFVLCLTIGAAGLVDLLWRVTGFTAGHTVTLILGFLGYAPTAGWFVPAVEVGIALTIILAGAVAVMGWRVRGSFLVTAAIGLLHGLGFSFVLQEILRLDAPNLWQSLLAFNLGVEVGQLAIVVAAWPVLWALARRGERAAEAARWVIALPCIAVASLWTSERIRLLMGAL